LITNLKQSSNGIPINMHNIYVTLSCLHPLDVFIILEDVSIQYICKANFFLKRLSKMTKPIPPKMQIKWYKFDNTQTKLLHIKTNINTETSNDLDNDPINCDDNNQWKFHQIKTNKNIEMSSDLENDLNEYDTIDYWHKELQLIKLN
jgi:hypothetical protein